mgnify:FL=1
MPVTTYPEVNGSSIYRPLSYGDASITATDVAGTYHLSGAGISATIFGTGITRPQSTLYIAAADLPTIDGVSAKLRIRAQLHTNNVAPGSNFTIGLYPITRPAASGGGGVLIYTAGTVVPGSTGAVFTAPAVDSSFDATSLDFALPADGHYALGVLTTGTLPTSSHVHIRARLDVRNA